MESVYLETSYISYLVALPSRDLVIAAHQQITAEWWNTQRDKFDCFISQFVIDEASLGDPDEVRKRLEIVKHLNALEVTAEVEELAGHIIGSGIIPQKAMNDAAHIAVAAIHGIDYICLFRNYSGRRERLTNQLKSPGAIPRARKRAKSIKHNAL